MLTERTGYTVSLSSNNTSFSIPAQRLRMHMLTERPFRTSISHKNFIAILDIIRDVRWNFDSVNLYRL